MKFTYTSAEGQENDKDEAYENAAPRLRHVELEKKDFCLQFSQVHHVYKF